MINLKRIEVSDKMIDTIMMTCCVLLVVETVNILSCVIDNGIKSITAKRGPKKEVKRLRKELRIKNDLAMAKKIMDELSV